MKVYGEEMAYWNENWYQNNLVKVLIEEEDYKLVSFYDDPHHPEVISNLLSKGENIEVISPQSLVDTIRTHARYSQTVQIVTNGWKKLRKTRKRCWKKGRNVLLLRWKKD